MTCECGGREPAEALDDVAGAGRIALVGEQGGDRVGVGRRRRGGWTGRVRSWPDGSRPAPGGGAVRRPGRRAPAAPARTVRRGPPRAAAWTPRRPDRVARRRPSPPSHVAHQRLAVASEGDRQPTLRRRLQEHDERRPDGRRVGGASDAGSAPRGGRSPARPRTPIPAASSGAELARRRARARPSPSRRRSQAGGTRAPALAARESSDEQHVRPGLADVGEPEALVQRLRRRRCRRRPRGGPSRCRPRTASTVAVAVTSRPRPRPRAHGRRPDRGQVAQRRRTSLAGRPPPAPRRGGRGSG